MAIKGLGLGFRVPIKLIKIMIIEGLGLGFGV